MVKYEYVCGKGRGRLKKLALINLKKLSSIKTLLKLDGKRRSRRTSTYVYIWCVETLQIARS